ncbi:Na+/H+ antiporter NhaC family protein [Alkaliphilus hydrothermalis]|uniref:NhaC family Na+:H+ antiporter n=1 Tax=Alkaliphilus hydrothermalis TaxID=1482730 RepID=A0ABS2NS10_9FIRM|nr:Na+/H+ antiporter NhaC family protein [Alkaliphilus hydrothermalis]MBM7615657.1 NhaC family Na+:H+ antiporter [Alkaliphilus hydrothermalis]
MTKEIKSTKTTTILIVTLLGIVLGIVYAGAAHYGLILGIFLTLGVGYQAGYPLGTMGKMMETGIKKAFIVLFIMSLIGILSALWMYSGTIPAMMLLGFKYLTKMNFLLAVFLITGGISLVLGTSIGTITTVGIPLLEIGKTLGLPLPMVVGAIISGAYIGDRTSPMSSSANLIAAVTESKLMGMLKEMLKTMAPVLVICISAYYIMGSGYGAQATVDLRVEEIKTLMNSHFIIEWYSLIPPAMILLLAVIKVPILYCMIAGVISSIGLITFTQLTSLGKLYQVMIKGYYPENPQIMELLSGGGLLSMKNVIIIIVASTALNGLMESMGMLQPLMDRYLKGIKNTGHLIYKTTLLSLLMVVATCNQSLAIIIPSRFLKDEYNRRRISTKKLGRTIADSGVVTVSLVPWNVNAIAITSILGVSTIKYFPYALLCFLLPISTVLWGYWESRKEKQDYNYQKHKKSQAGI